MSLIKRVVLLITLLLCFAPLSAQKADAQLLAQAYRDNDLQKLTQFCKNWQSELPPITNEELAGLNDTLKAAYHLFSDFFDRNYTRKTLEQPWQLAKKDTPFYIVQNSLAVFVSNQQVYYSQHQVDSFILSQIGSSLPDSLKNRSYSDQELDSLIVKIARKGKETGSPLAFLRSYRDNISPYSSSDIWKKGKLMDTIKDFRPQLHSDIRWLYWSKNKYDIINRLNFNPPKAQKNNPSYSIEFKKFLDKIIAYIPCSGGPNPTDLYYHFPQTTNYVSAITFDKKLEYALVTLSRMDSGQTDIWHYQNGRWEYVSTISRYTIEE